ncbi:leucine-rich repeat-containing protein 4C-like [Pecten maximus]|uniref:leucine-rich repeat-containing protein 4C-like n=1 Tax=Pecten maximus TaxID=6579 RepID=UPI001458CB9B|nr:leucine-rich repeat-containing protein 4C-like [Pecten maximus]
MTGMVQREFNVKVHHSSGVMNQYLGTLLFMLVFYQTCNQCETLYRIDQCPLITCKCSPKSKLVNCTGSDMKYIPVLPTYAQNVIFTKTNFPNITAEFLYNLTLIRVIRLHFVDTLTRIIDPDAFVKLTNLSTLEISGSYELKPDMISPILLLTPRIETVQLKSNHWETIPGDMFLGLHNSSIQSITLRDNVIESISGTYFSDLRFLKRLDLSNNQLLDLNLTGLESTSISYINLANNNFRKVPSFCGPTGQPTGKYKTLDFQKNYLQKLDGSSFQCLQVLQNLNLDRTSITVIRTNTFVKLPKLEKLSLTHIGDHLRSIQGFAFNSSSLKETILHG